MNTKITITSNGRVSPNATLDLGTKYESVGDTLTFKIPEEYVGCHHYLAFHMNKKPSILLPVNNLQFVIGNTVTRNPGTYDILFLATSMPVVNGDIEDAQLVFISSTMKGEVKDNFLTDPTTDDELDPNLHILYEDLLALRDDLNTKKATDFWRGDFYYPTVDAVGNISWEIKEGRADLLPTKINIKGPKGDTGGYYVPSAEDGVIAWTGTEDYMSNPATIDLKPLVKNSSDAYLDTNLKPLVDAAVDGKFKWTWDDANQILYIVTEDTIK